MWTVARVPRTLNRPAGSWAACWKALAVGVLGCARRYDAVIHWQGGRRVFAELDAVTQVTWGRKLDDYSQATVTLAKRELSAQCWQKITPQVAEDGTLIRPGITPWAHELSIYRECDLVWQGPIVQWTENTATIEIDARDMLAWSDRRVIDVNLVGQPPDNQYHGETGQVLRDIFTRTWPGIVLDPDNPPEDRTSWDNPGLYARIDPTPGRVTTTETVWKGSRTVGDLVRDIIANGIDMFTLGRKIYLLPDYTATDLTRAPYRLTQDHIQGDIEVRALGLDMATEGFVVTQPEGSGQNAAPIFGKWPPQEGPGGPGNPSTPPYFGRITRFYQSTSLTSTTNTTGSGGAPGTNPTPPTPNPPGPVPPAPNPGPPPTHDLGPPDPEVAKVVYLVGREMNVSNVVMLAAFETGLVESHMRNLDHGDRDSVGVFQQRPSEGWGTKADCLNVNHAAHAFFQRAVAEDRAQPNRTAGQIAQAVQRSGNPGAYDAAQGQARQLLNDTRNAVSPPPPPPPPDAPQPPPPDASNPKDNPAPALQQVAQAIRAYGFPCPMAIVVPDQASLTPKAPITIGQLVPGRAVSVELTRYVNKIHDLFRINEVQVTWSSQKTGTTGTATTSATTSGTTTSSGTGGGPEQVQISLVTLRQPPIPDDSGSGTSGASPGSSSGTQAPSTPTLPSTPAA